MPAYRGSNYCVTRHASAVVVSGGVAAGSALGEPWYVRTLRLPCPGRRCSSSSMWALFVPPWDLPPASDVCGVGVWRGYRGTQFALIPFTSSVALGMYQAGKGYVLI